MTEDPIRSASFGGRCRHRHDPPLGVAPSGAPTPRRPAASSGPPHARHPFRCQPASSAKSPTLHRRERQRHARDPPPRRAEGRTQTRCRIRQPLSQRMLDPTRATTRASHGTNTDVCESKGGSPTGVAADEDRPWHAHQTARQTRLRSIPPHAGTARPWARRRPKLGRAVIHPAHQSVLPCRHGRLLRPLARSPSATPCAKPTETPAKASPRGSLQAGPLPGSERPKPRATIGPSPD